MNGRFLRLSAPTPTKRCKGRILLVEDEPTMRMFMEALLLKRGFTVVNAASTLEAQAKILEDGCATFQCIITDYMMPGETGLDLLRWVTERDPHLGVIIVTAENERRILAESLRDGAGAFLDKPVAPEVFHASVERVVAASRHKRRQAAAEAAIQEVARMQHLMRDPEPESRQQKPEIDTFSRPKSEVGGDFLNHFAIGTHDHFVLLTDVSGHDLKAAFISAYFQGIVRGMLEGKVPVPKVFEFFNQYLLREWISGEPASKTSGVSASVAVGAVLIESQQKTALVFTCGSPRPVYLAPNGEGRIVGEPGSAPLGWFPENPVKSARHPFAEGGAFFLWTDGLETFAEEQQISAPALATLLLLAQHQLRLAPDFGSQQDDILVTRVGVPDPQNRGEGFLPLLVEEYTGAEIDRIDTLQAFWAHSLLYCLPELAQDDAFNVILAAREAVLNALHHGCSGSAEKRARFCMSFCPAKNLLRLVVSDDGPGYEFDWNQFPLGPSAELTTKHRGLMLIHNLASRVSTERNGASLTLDFKLNKPLALGNSDI